MDEEIPGLNGRGLGLAQHFCPVIAEENKNGILMVM